MLLLLLLLLLTVTVRHGLLEKIKVLDKSAVLMKIKVLHFTCEDKSAGTRAVVSDQELN